MKHKFLVAIAALCYWLGLDSLFYWLNRKKKRIITFHNVMPEDLLPFGKEIGLTDAADVFRKKIRIIKERFEVNTDLFDAKSVTITFDDGYLNQAEVAGRILDEEGNLPAIVFVAGRMLNQAKAEECLVIDRILHWTFLAPDGHYKLACPCAVMSNFELNPSNRQQIWQQCILPSFFRDSHAKGFSLLSELDSQYSMNKIFKECDETYLRLRLTGLSDTIVDQLRSKGWIVGWHTQEHYPLSQLSLEQKVMEIDKLAPPTMKNHVFSYPYGELNSVDADSIRIAKDAGYPYAVSNVSDANEFIGNHFMPRMMLMTDNKYLIHLELSGLKHFIKSKKLLS